MITRRVPLFLLLLAFATSAHAQDLTLDQILQKNLAALGGAEAITGIRTLTMDARMVMQGGAMEAPLKILVKRPSMIRTEFTIQGQGIVTAWDGTSGWMINPMTGSADAQKLDDGAARAISQNAELEVSIGVLSGLKSRGDTLELVGKEDVSGASAYKIKVTRKSGDTQTYLLDASSFLPVKVVTKMVQGGQEMEVESFPSSYKKVNGVMMAFVNDQKVGGRPMMQLLMDKVEANLPIDDVVFKMPAAAPKPAPVDKK